MSAMDGLDVLRGVTVALVAPSGFPVDAEAPARAVARLESFGCRVVNLFDPARSYQRFGGTDAARAAQLAAAASDPEVEVVLALRGGYGMSRLLPMLDLDALAQSGKLFVGHSDFTALQLALLAHAGTVTFAGPMACDDFSRDDPSAFTMEQFHCCLGASVHSIDLSGDAHPVADVEGVLWGGNLTMLAHLAGTRYMPDIRGGILFVEEVNEHPYRVERMCLQLLHAGLLDQKALVFGDVSRYRVLDHDNGYDFDAMLGYLRSTLGIPVFTGLPFGHVRDKATLAVGATARLQSDGVTATITMTGYPTLAQGRSGR